MAETEKSKKPSNSAFKQQRLKAWQPLLTPKAVLPTFFVIGIIFIPLGVGLYITSQQVSEVIVDYTNCNTAPLNWTSENLGDGVYSWKYENNTCYIQFEVRETFSKPVFLYYRLTNFYQNHRRYVKSFNSNQLKGSAVPLPSLTDCSPLAYVPAPEGLQPSVVYYPCGLISNSIFNDTFSNLTSSGGSFTFSENGIAWPGDAKRYGPSEYPGNVTGVLPNVAPPPDWSSFGGVYTSDNFPDLSKDEHFQVWMRTAGLPTFRKLYGKSEFDLLPGIYTITINDRYPVTIFQGTKSFVISTSSWMGGKNPFLGIAYMVVGSICIALGVAFLIRHLVAPRKLGDHNYIKWKNN